MATINEQIVTGRKFRKLIDEANKLWQRISIWTKASDVEFDDGQTAETKMGAIKGITTDINVTEPGYAADMIALAQLNSEIETGITVRYNAKTDYIEVYSGQGWHNLMLAGLFFDGYLYNRGKVSKYFSGFSGNGISRFDTDHINIIAGPVTGTNYVTMKSNEIDFTKYKKLIINANSSIYTYGAYFTNVYVQNKSDGAITSKAMLSTSAATYELNISNIRNGYIVIESYLYNISNSFNNSIYLIQII